MIAVTAVTLTNSTFSAEDKGCAGNDSSESANRSSGSGADVVEKELLIKRITDKISNTLLSYSIILANDHSLDYYIQEPEALKDNAQIAINFLQGGRIPLYPGCEFHQTDDKGNVEYVALQQGTIYIPQRLIDLLNGVGKDNLTEYLVELQRKTLDICKPNTRDAEDVTNNKIELLATSLHDNVLKHLAAEDLLEIDKILTVFVEQMLAHEFM